jgi:1,4-dihydroxy-2-naphthoate polyprenyltransferase
MNSFMSSEESPNSEAVSPFPAPSSKTSSSLQIVKAESVQAEEVPTISLESLQTVSELHPEVSVYSVAPTPAVVLPAPLVAQEPEYHRGLREWLSIWWDGIRPAYLLLSLLPVILGSIAAWTQSISHASPHGIFHPVRFIVALAAVFLLQIGAHLINDYYDYSKGIDTSNSLGPGGLIQQGLINPVRVLYFGLAALGLGALLGIIIATSVGWLAFVFGIFGLLAAFFYSGTSGALSSFALGELVSFFVFGPWLTLGAYLVQTGHLDRVVFIYSISLGLLATACIHINNMRDVESDAQAGKHTLAYLLGLRFSRAFYLLLLLGAYAPIVALGLPSHAPHLLLLVLWTLPGLAVVVAGVLRTASPASLHVVMRQTLTLETLFTLLLVVALVVTAILPALLHMLPHLPAITLPF